MNIDPKKLADQYKPKQIKLLQPDRQLCMVRCSPCGKVLAAAGQDATVRRWDLTADAAPELPPLRGHGGWVSALAFHGDGKRLFSVDSWGQVCAWPYADREARPLWSVNPAHEGWVRALDLSPDGKLLATCGLDQVVRLWSADDGKKVKEFVGHKDDVFAVAFHPDGKSLVSGDHKGVVRHWDLASSRCVRELDAKVLYLLNRLQDVGGVRCLSFDRTGTFLACGGTQPKNGGNVQGTPTVVVFDWASGKAKHTLKNFTDGDGYVYEAHFHPDGFLMMVSSGNPGTGKFFFQVPGEEKPFFTAPLPNCHSLAVHPDGKRLVVSATNGGSNGNGRVLGKNKEYPGNFSPLHVFDITGAAGTAPTPVKKKA